MGVVLLAGCGGLDGTQAETTRASFFAPKSSEASSATVLDGQFKIAGPRGYCVDSGASRETAKGAFVILGHCRALDVKGPKARQAAVITVSIAPNAGEVDEPTLDALSSFLSSDKGRATLRRSYGAHDVVIEDMEREAGLLVLRANDGGSNEMSAEYWRAIMGLHEALVTVTVSGLKEEPSDAATLRGLVFDTAVRLQNLNAKQSSEGAQSVQSTPKLPAEKPAKPLKDWLNRLL
ncbi:MAG: hypothetical protein ACRBCL_04885 [Maritimibacter sp.]